MNPNELWQVLKRRWLPATLAAGTLMGVGSLYNYLQKPVYESRGKILFKEQQTILTGSGVNMTHTPAQLIRSNSVIQTAIATVGINQSASQVQDNIKVGTLGANNTLEVSYRSADPQQAAKLLQKMMEIYLQQDLLSRRQSLQQNRGQMQQQLPGITSALRSAQANFTKFKEEFKVTDVTAEKATLVNALKYLDQEITTNKNQLAAIQPNLQKLQDTFGRDAMITLRSSLTNESTGMHKLLVALQTVEQQLAFQRTNQAETNTVVQDLKKKQSLIKAELQKESQRSMVGSIQFQGKLVQWQQNSNVKQEMIKQLLQLETQRDSWEKTITALGEIQKSGQERLKLFPKMEEQFNALEQVLANTTSNYNQVTAQLQTQASDLSEIGQITSAATVSKQPIDIPTSMPPLLLLLGSLLTGGGLAYGLDKSDRRLKSVAAVQKILTYPLLGSVPQLRLAPKDSSQRTPVDPAATVSFGMLRDNLAALNERSPAQVIVISSALRGEGKSTIAANLAIAVSQQQRRVLLIDADLQEPGQHKFWQIDNGLGLSNVLQQEAQFAESVVEVASNLELLTAGTLHYNPVSLFSSPAMVELITQWFELYDRVIIDSSAFTQGAEAMLLAKMSDGLVLVVRPDIAEAKDLQKAQEMLVKSQPQVLGMVINGVAGHEQLMATPPPKPRSVTAEETMDTDDMFVPRAIDQ